MLNKTENNQSSENRITLTKRQYNFIFGYILITSILILLFSIIIVYEIWQANFCFSFHFDDVITVLLAVLGVFIAFTAINIYSIFNVRVDEEKYALEKLRVKYKDRISDYDKQIKELKDAHEELKKEMTNYKKGLNSLVGKFDLEIALDIIIDKHASVIDRATATWKYITFIENQNKAIADTVLNEERVILRGELERLKEKIKEKIKYKHFGDIKNNTLKNAIDKLNSLIN